MGTEQVSGADRAVPVGVFLKAVDKTFDTLLAKLGCVDGTDARLVSHWQDDSYLISVTRNSDGKSLHRTVRLHDAAILPPFSTKEPS